MMVVWEVRMVGVLRDQSAHTKLIDVTKARL